jgi:hypothetical protein
VRVRKLAAAVATAVLVVAGLSACDSNAGTAAVVDGHRITNSDVSKYVQPNAQPFDTQSGKVVPRGLVLNTLIAQRLYEKALRENGGMPSAAQLNEARRKVLQGGAESDLTKQIVASGFTASFEPVYIRTQALEQVLEDRAQQGADVKKITKSLGAHVKVSPEYGTWGENGLTDDPTQGQPPFVTFNSAATAAAAG